jgi:molybdenum cofactor cytidylyltransferase
MSVAIVILAAGASTRMGTPKQLLPYRGRSLIRQIAETAIASVCQPVAIVLGANAVQIYPHLDRLPVQIIENPHWTEGMGTSIRSGIQWLQTQCDRLEAVVLAVCDQPFVSPPIVDRLVETYYATGQPIIASEYASTLGVPALFHHSLFPELIQLQPTQGAKQIVKKYSHLVVPVPFPEGAIDLDTPRDYEQLQHD